MGLHIVRFIGLLLMWPLMRLTGYEFHFAHVCLLSYSGLRGAVGLCLALIVKNTSDISEEIQTQTMFFTAGIVLLTLLINGTTPGFVIRKLGLARENEVSLRIL